MPPVPDTFAISPLNSSVVALLRIFGPMILNTVPPTANIITAASPYLYAPIYPMIFFSVPLKSFAFSPGIIP